MDRITRLRIFASTANTLSFSKTARAMGLARSSVTKAINELEIELGARLLDRTTRSVALTPEGTAFQERCLGVLDAFDETHRMFTGDTVRPSGRVRASVPSVTARNIIAPALPDFFARYPDVDVELHVSHRPDAIVREGLDCLLRVGDKTDSELIARKLAELPLITCASPSYLQAHGVPHTLRDLCDHHAVGYATPFTKGLWRFAGAASLSDRTIERRNRVTATNADTYIACCMAGLGLIQIPAVAVRDEMAAGTLVEVLPEIPAGSLPMAILYAHRRNLTPRVKAFVSWLSDLMRNVAREDAAARKQRLAHRNEAEKQGTECV